MILKIHDLDVFTDRPFRGNPTTVVLNSEGLSHEEMQAVARELNLETTFVSSPIDLRAVFRLHYFMPLCRIELCGHGTIGAIWALAEEGTIPRGLPELTVETPVGFLKIELEWEEERLKKVVMDQLPPKFARPDCSAEEVAQVLGITPDSIVNAGLPLTSASTGRAKLLIPVTDRQALDSITPNRGLLEELCRRIRVTGLYAFTMKPRNQGAAAEARQFPCGGGVVEDPVTGVAACALGAYLVYHPSLTPRDRDLAWEGSLRGYQAHVPTTGPPPAAAPPPPPPGTLGRPARKAPCGLGTASPSPPNAPPSPA
ncbi:MAG TPA: PhzF family phenazine biosynthesis protein [Candidatus Acetothermia bacterium]|nr:PhzF family phenazine biosynthesis protein [Candidatus Acetothermia bacterium]